MEFFDEYDLISNNSWDFIDDENKSGLFMDFIEEEEDIEKIHYYECENNNNDNDGCSDDNVKIKTMIMDGFIKIDKINPLLDQIENKTDHMKKYLKIGKKIVNELKSGKINVDDIIEKQIKISNIMSSISNEMNELNLELNNLWSNEIRDLNNIFDNISRNIFQISNEISELKINLKIIIDRYLYLKDSLADIEKSHFEIFNEINKFLTF
jgi:predicted phage tail protein